MVSKKKSGKKSQNSQRPKVQVLHALDMQNVAVQSSRSTIPHKVEEKTVIDNVVSAFARLRTWNLILTAIYVIQAIVLGLVTVSQRFPISSNFFAKDPLQTAALGKQVLVPASHHLFDINITVLLIIGFIIFAVTHFIYATKYRSHYETDLMKSQNPVHWVSSILTGGLSLSIIALLVGVQDISLLLAMIGLVIISNVLEMLFEKFGSNAFALMVVAKFTNFLPWVIIALYLIFGGIYGNAVPAYVYWAFGVLYLGFAAIAANVWLHYKGSAKADSRWANPLFAERLYATIGLISQTAFAWILYVGVLHP